MYLYNCVPSDPSLNEENVKKVMEEVKAWNAVAQFGLSIPGDILTKFVTECFNERKSALASYIVTTLPNVTWEGIAAKLYYSDEMSALEQAKVYIHRFTGE